MDLPLRPVDEQVIVITGASSGIGLVTAKRAAARGARVVLVARNEGDLERAVQEIRLRGGRAIHVVADVSDLKQVEHIANRTLREFGRLDTWVNNAAVAVFGRVMELPVEDMRRQMDVNYWGYVYGSRVAVRHLREHGGALINVASAISDRAVPLQVNYSAAGNAIKAFTDGLRRELEDEGIPVSVTLVKPGSIDTPLFDKAKTYLGVEPKPVPPVYAPEIVSDVILSAAQRPVRELTAGAPGTKLRTVRFAPRIDGHVLERWRRNSRRTDHAAYDRPDNLYEPVADDGGERGRNWRGHTRKRSTHAGAFLPSRAVVAGVAAIAAGLTVMSAVRKSSGSRRSIVPRPAHPA